MSTPVIRLVLNEAARSGNRIQFMFCQRRTIVNLSKFIPSQTAHQKTTFETYNGRISGIGRWSTWSRTMASASEPGAASSSLPLGYIPAPPVPPTITGTDAGSAELLEQLNALGEPTLQSLGLGSWYPSGMVQCAVEALHVNIDVPWWTSIVIGTCIIRLLMFPLVILAQRNAAMTHNHTPVMQQLQAKFTKAKQSGNPMEAAKYGSELANYMKMHNVNPLKQMLIPMAQMPVFLSVFIGLRGMANLPVESMKTGGVLWFTDLTIPDPYYALPVLTMATFLCTLEFGTDGVRAASMSTNMRYFMRAMPFIMLPFIINFPSALLCYWLTTNVFSFVQVMFLKIAPVKKYFNIPELVKHADTVMASQKKPFFKNIKDTYRNSKTVFDVEEMQRKEAVRFKEAGLGAIQKTYSYDPTKVGKKAQVNSRNN